MRLEPLNLFQLLDNRVLVTEQALRRRLQLHPNFPCRSKILDKADKINHTPEQIADEQWLDEYRQMDLQMILQIDWT
jgi:hypothetical protein